MDIDPSEAIETFGPTMERTSFLTLGFQPPSPPVGENQVRGWHWAPVRRILDPWRDVTWAEYHALPRKTHDEVKGRPALVCVAIPFGSRRRRDPHNYVSTVVKAIVDGLVLAGQWPDDTPEYVTVHEPHLYLATPTVSTVLVRLCERN